MRILLTGGSGFLARYLFPHLSLDGGEVLRSDVKAPHGSGIVQCDFSESNEVERLIREFSPDQIYHLAGTFTNDYMIDWRANYQGTKNLLDAVHLYSKATRVLLVGSAAEYGHIQESDCPIPEDHPLRPASIYGLTKAMQTMLMHYCCSSWKMNVVMARLFNLIGRGISERLFIGTIFAQLESVCAGKASTIAVGNLESRRDYLSGEKAANGMELVMKRGTAGQTYNVASGFSRRLYDVLVEILEEKGLGMDIVRVGAGNRGNTYDPKDIYADITKLKALERASEEQTAGS